MCRRNSSRILKHYRNCIPLEKIYPDSLISISDSKAARAACLFDQGNCCLFGEIPDIENAIRFFHHAVDLGMDAPELIGNLALALYLDGQRKEGVELLRQHQQLLPQAAANLKILENYGEDNDPIDIRQFAIADIKHPVVAAAQVGQCNQLSFTKKCIDSIYKHTREPFEIIVVDNGSTDGTIPYFEALSKKRGKTVLPLKL